MTGALMQLVAYGAQDVYLTGNPQITFYNAVLKRHTNFSMEPHGISPQGQGKFGNKVEFVISRQGDLVHKMYLNVEVSAAQSTSFAWKWVDHLGYNLIKDVEVEIGGQKVDKHLGQWMYLWNELSGGSQHNHGTEKMIGKNQENARVNTNTSGTFERKRRMYIPLQFWFCKHAGNSLPLISLQYHEVRVKFNLSDINACTMRESGVSGNTLTGSIDKCELLTEYVYLDTEERKRFAQNSHEYIIEQVQDPAVKQIPANTSSTSIELNFNHPVKEIVWIAPPTHSSDTSTSHLGDSPIDIITSFIARYILGTGTLAKGEVYTVKVPDASAPVLTLQQDDDVTATAVCDQQLNKNYDHINDENDYSDSFDPFVQDLNALKLQVSPSADLTIASSATSNAALRSSISVNEDDLAQFIRNHPGVFGRTFAELEDAGSSASNFFAAAPTAIDNNLIGGSVTNVGATSTGGNTIKSGKLKLNGQDRFEERDANYLSEVQASQHHSNAPPAGIYLYSFALNPEELQPSGTCNFSRIDNSQLELKFNSKKSASTVSVYALNYNVLRIMSGMGGMAYSN